MASAAPVMEYEAKVLDAAKRGDQHFLRSYLDQFEADVNLRDDETQGTLLHVRFRLMRSLIGIGRTLRKQARRVGRGTKNAFICQILQSIEKTTYTLNVVSPDGVVFLRHANIDHLLSAAVYPITSQEHSHAIPMVVYST